MVRAIQVLIVRLFLAAVVLDAGWPNRGNVDETVLFVVVVGLVIVVGTEIGTPNVCQGREMQSRCLEQGKEMSFDSWLYISLPERRRYLYLFMTKWLGQ